MLRGAFIGFGNVAANGHLPGWLSSPAVEIVAATDGMPARREVFQAACPRARWFESADALLAEASLDFVDICTPPVSHEALILQALGAGFHVLCEKPLVTGPAEAVGAAAVRAGRVLHTVHNWLEAPICRRISALIAEGAVGAVRSLQWQTLRSRPAVALTAPGSANWRTDPALAGGGILVDHGWHALYCVLRWAGAAPTAIAARLETRRHKEWRLEDTAAVDLDFPAARGAIFLTWAAEERANRIEIEGERGRIHIEGESVILDTAAGERRWACPPALHEGSHHPDWFAGVAKGFLAAIGGGKANLGEALLCARLIALAQDSSAAGGERLAV